MKKKLIAIVLCAVLIMSVLPTVGLADYNGSGHRSRNYNCSHCSLCGSINREAAQLAILEGMVTAANAQIEALVKMAQATPYDDVDRLLMLVDRIIGAVFAYADQIGATVECEYVEYYIDGQYILIDPIRVVRG